MRHDDNYELLSIEAYYSQLKLLRKFPVYAIIEEINFHLYINRKLEVIINNLEYWELNPLEKT